MLPNLVTIAIGMAVSFLVVNGLRDIANRFGVDFTSKGQVVATVITTIVIFAINTILQAVVTVDPTTKATMDNLLQLVVLILGMLGIKQTMTQFAQMVSNLVVQKAEELYEPDPPTA